MGVVSAFLKRVHLRLDREPARAEHAQGGIRSCLNTRTSRSATRNRLARAARSCVSRCSSQSMRWCSSPATETGYGLS